MSKNLAQMYPARAERLLRAVMKMINFVLISTGLLMSVTFFIIVIMRYGFDADLFAYEEWLMALCFWMFFLGSAAGTHDERHIKADILGFMISSPRIAWIRKIFVYAIELVILLFVNYWAWLMIKEEVLQYPQWQSTVALKIPFLVPRLGIFLGFFLSGVFTVLHIRALLLQEPAAQPATQKEPEEGRIP